jgi:hypothetical protein
MKEKNKRGFEIAISTIVLLILGLVVLIVLILLFTGQAQRFLNYLSGSASDVDDAVSICNSQTFETQSYAYCCEKKKVQIQGEKLELSCMELSERIGRIDFKNCSSVFCG